MFLYIALTFVLAVDTVLCVDCSRDCKAEKWDNAPRSKASEECKAGKEWRACLDKLLTQGCDVMSRYTQELNNADRSCDEKDPEDSKTADCSTMIDCSTNDEIEATSKPSKKCALAKKWRSCLVTFMDSCTVEFPFELNVAEAMNCFLPDDDDDDDSSDDDADKDGDSDDDSADGSDSGKTTKSDDDKTGGSDGGNTTKSDDDKTGGSDGGNTTKSDDDNTSGSGGDDNTGGADDDKDDDDDDDDDEDEDECETSYEACDANEAKVDSAQGDLNKCVYVLGWKSCYTSVVKGKGCPTDKDRDEKVAELESTYCGVRRN